MKLLKYDDLWNTDPFYNFNSTLNSLFANNYRHSNPARNHSKGFRMDTFSNENGYTLVAELPGFSKEEVTIQTESGVLKIEASRGSTDQEKVKASRSISIGNDIDTNNVTAKLENGLLTINLPRSVEQQARAITVN